MRRKVLYALIVLTLLAPSTAVTAAPAPAEEPAPVVQEAEAKSYRLQLDMPEVNVSPSTQPADVPGFYHGALARQWTEVEGVLKALQEQELVESYTLLPEANAFSVTAQPAAEGQLQQLGALSEQGMMAQAAQAEVDQFQAKLDAAIQEAQAQAAPMEQPEAPTAPEERSTAAESAQSDEPEIQTVDVREFDFTSNPDDDLVYGTTDANVVTDTYGMTQTLAVWPGVDEYGNTGNWAYDSNYGKYVMERLTGTLAGFYVAQNPFYDGANPNWGSADLDWDPGQRGHLRHINAEGHYIYDDFQAEEEVEVYVRGYNGGYAQDNHVTVDHSNCDSAEVKLGDSDGVKASGSGCQVDFQDTYGNPINIEAEDTITVTVDGQTTTVDVPTFNVTSNPDTDTVSGNTPDATVVTDTISSYGMTQTLTVWPNTLEDRTWSPLKNVLPDASDDFTATNPFYQDWMMGWMTTTKDIQPGDRGHLRHINADGHYVYDDFQADYLEPTLFVRGDNGYEADNRVEGEIPGYSGYGTVTLKDSGGTVKAQETSVWANPVFTVDFEDAAGNPIDIKAGDSVEATFGEKSATVNVPDFTVTSDVDSDTVSGNTDATVVTDTYGLTRTLTIWSDQLWDGATPRRTVTTTASGEFTATFPAGEIDPGDHGHLRYVDANENRVYDAFAALHDEPEIHVHKDGNYVWGYVSKADAPVTVTLKTSDTVKGTAYSTADYAGWFHVGLYNDSGTPVTIEEGDDVVVEASSVVTVPVVHLTGQADVKAETVFGEGPANDQLLVDVGPDQTATTDENGVYSADFKGTEDIEPGEYVRVEHRNDEGHTVYITFYVGPKLNAQLNSYYAWGYSVAANAPLTVTLKDDSGNVKGSDTDISDNNNHFSAYLYDDTGQRATVEAGDVLEADFGNGAVVSMEVTDMTADVDADTDTISGTGPKNDKLGVSVGSFDETVDTDDGNWSTDASEDEDIEPGDQVLVKHINENYHETWLYAVAPVVYVRGTGNGSTAYQADNYVSGYASRRATVNVTLKDDAGATVASRQVVAGSGDGHYATSLYDALGNAADIQGGDQVIVSASPDETIDVPEIDAEVDPDTNTITGTTSLVGKDLGLAIAYYGWGWMVQSQTVRTDSNGDFVATFDAINSGDRAYIRYQNSDGHWIHTLFETEETGDTEIYARWDGGGDVCSNCASGYASASDTVATVMLKRGGSTLATETDMTGGNRWFNVEFTNAAGQTVPIENGDVIEVMSSETVSMTVEDITVEANAESDTLYGTGPANEDLEIRGDCWGSTTVDPDGSWVYDGCGLGNGDEGYIYHTDSDEGHRTYLSWAVPYVRVREHGNYVGGTVKRGVPVTVTLQSSGGSERAVETTTSDRSNGWFGVNFQDAAGDPLIINPDDTVLVQASPAITVPVTPLSAEVDTANDQVTGSGPAGEQLDVDAGGCDRDVTVQSDGTYTADFSGECDLMAGDAIQVDYRNDEGNVVYLDFDAPMVRVNIENDIVDGYATPNASASLTLKRGGSTVATATASTGMDGWFSAFFTDASGNLVDIQAGDTVEVTASPTVDVDVVELSASVNVANDTITGSGPANSLLLVRAVEPGIAWNQKSVQTDENGDFTADFSGQFDITSVGYAYVRYTDGEGNQTSVHTTPARSPLLDAAEQAVEDEGGTVETSTFGAANDGDLTPPITYQGGGGGKTVFASEGGTLVITRPDGSVDDTGVTQFTVDNAPSGEWKVQVRVGGGEGEQYAIAVGRAAHTLYLPLVTRNAGQ
jgi:hypothetical protein